MSTPRRPAPRSSGTPISCSGLEPVMGVGWAVSAGSGGERCCLDDSHNILIIFDLSLSESLFLSCFRSKTIERNGSE